MLKSLQGIEAAADTLEQLWVSYNQIDKLKPLRNMTKLKVHSTFSHGFRIKDFHGPLSQVLYMSHNFVREWREFEHMTELPELEDLVFIGNPLEEEMTAAGRYTEEVIKRLLYLKVRRRIFPLKFAKCKR